MKIKLLIFLLLILNIKSLFATVKTTDSLKSEIGKAKKNEEKIRLLNELAGDYVRQGKGKDAVYCYTKVITLAKADAILKAQTYNEIGNVESDLGNNTQALKAYHLGLKAADGRDFSLIAKINKNIGALYLSWKKFDDALKYANIAEDFAIKAKDKRTVADLANNKGAAYEQKLQYATAKANYQKALRFYLAEKIDDRICLTYNNLAVLAKVQFKFKEAAAFYELAVRYGSKTENKWVTAAIANNLGSLFTEMNDFKRSDEELQRALKIEKEINAGELIYQTLENLAINEKKKGNFKKAYEYMLLNAEAKDKYINVENTNELAKLQEEFDGANKQKKIELLAKETKIQQLTLGKKNTTIAIIIGVFIALGLITTLLFSRYKIRQESKIKVATIETKSKVQEEKLRISKELHDNVGAQLTFINMAISNLSKRNANDKELQEINHITQTTIRELRSTVWLINKQVFSLDEFVMRLREYIKPLHIGKLKIIIQDESAENLSLEPLMATNLFRVLQEVVNNAIKHADATELNIGIRGLANRLEINISDNGKGFDLAQQTYGCGLQNICDRVESLNGTCEFVSAIAKGTQINIKIPFEA